MQALLCLHIISCIDEHLYLRSDFKLLAKSAHIYGLALDYGKGYSFLKLLLAFLVIIPISLNPLPLNNNLNLNSNLW